MTDRSDLLSIIVPVFNEVRTIRQVLERLVEISLPLGPEGSVRDEEGTR